MREERRDRHGRQRGEARFQAHTKSGHRRSGGSQPERSQQAPADRRRSSDPSRLLAFDVLQEVTESDSYANLVLPPRLSRQNIVGRDAAFTTELTYGTLRMQGRYDAVLALCVNRPLDQLDGAVLNALRLGAHQILGMRVPTHAAVSETVGLVRVKIGTGPSQLVNAVLRKVAAASWEEWEARLLADAATELEGLAATQSHPLWIVRALKEALHMTGRNPDELAALLEADNTAPKVSLIARPGLISRPELLEAAGGTAGKVSPYSVVLSGSDPGSIAAIRDGRAGVQDEGSQIVAAALTQVAIEGTDDRWLDLCAGPGGKAALLGAIAATRGAKIVANEISDHRTKLVKDNLKALPESAIETVIAGDGRLVGIDAPESFDRVLVDAPCTGLGALRRRPESRWRRKATDIPGLSQLQRELLTAALDATRPGGVVAYVTCSPHVAETRFVVQDVLRKRSDAEVIDAREPIASMLPPNSPLDLGENLDVQLWPHVHGTDAMHLTLIRKSDK